jgi:hypothetical protein
LLYREGTLTFSMPAAAREERGGADRPWNWKKQRERGSGERERWGGDHGIMPLVSMSLGERAHQVQENRVKDFIIVVLIVVIIKFLLL